MAPANKNPARTPGGVREKNDVADGALRSGTKLERSPLESSCIDAEMRRLARQELARIQLGWGQPSERQLQWCFRQGITWNALLRPWPVGATRVRFTGRVFHLDPQGVRALTFVAWDQDKALDIVAWSPKTGELASWRNVAFCLGNLDEVFNPGTYFSQGALPVHDSPLPWLRSNREGIVILRYDLIYPYLRNIARLSFSDAAHARHVQFCLQPPKPRVEVLIGTPAELPK